MSTVRVLFLARYRIPHALFWLQWDHYLQGIDRTIVATPLTREELWPMFERYGIDKLRDLDASRFNAVCDAVPDLTQSMQYDYATGRVVDFDRYWAWVNAAIR